MKIDFLYVDKIANRIRYLITIKNSTFEFFTGLAWLVSDSHAKPANSIHNNGYWIKLPDNNTVLEALYSDYRAGQLSFFEFCEDFGYNTDSRKDLEVYFACMETTDKIKELIRDKVLAVDNDNASLVLL